MRNISLFILLAAANPSQAQEIAQLKADARRWFQEAQGASDDDGGTLWGHELYGPMMFFDPTTNLIIANQGDREGKLKEERGIWVGSSDPTIPYANTALTWAGVEWTLVVTSSIASNPVERARLMMHECFHRIQDDLGLPSASVTNDHLDSKDGRIWLRLEWSALSQALVSWGPERKQALADALIFRAYRRSLFPGSAVSEDRMEMHEGLAEYTGIVLQGVSRQAARWHMAGRLKVNALKPSYPMSFAYETGPCYGLVLDMDFPDWRKGLTPQTSLSGLLSAANTHLDPENLQNEAMKAATRYDFEELVTEETARAEGRAKLVAHYTEVLVNGPVLVLPLSDGYNYNFDPNAVVPMGTLGDVFPTTKITDKWGAIEVEQGLRLDKTGMKAFVAAPTCIDGHSGPGWTLTLNPPWRVVKIDNNWTLDRSQ